MTRRPERPALVCAGCGHRIVVEAGLTVGHYPSPTVPDLDAPLCRGSFYPPVRAAQ